MSRKQDAVIVTTTEEPEEPKIESKEETKEEVKVTAKEVIKPVATPVEAVMYVGPSIQGLINHSTVFKDGVLEDAVQKKIEKNPYMKKLFVPLSGIVEAYKEIAKKDSALNVFINKVKEEN